MDQSNGVFTPEQASHITRVRGSLHAYDHFDAATTALVVIDLQNFFMEPGSPVEVPAAREIVPDVNRLAAVLRAQGGTVAWVQNHKPADDEALHALTSRIFGPAANAHSTREMALDGHGFQLWPKLEVEATDLRVVKTRYSALIQGSSDLDEQLRRLGVDTVLVAGTVTNVCCESTARDAMMLGYRVVMLADGVAAHTDAEQQSTLVNIARCFGDVYTIDELIEHLD